MIAPQSLIGQPLDAVIKLSRFFDLLNREHDKLSLAIFNHRTLKLGAQHIGTFVELIC